MVIFSGLDNPIFDSLSSSSQFTEPEKYYAATLNSEPNELLNIALSTFTTKNTPPGLAIDLGCGSGRNTAVLLKNGWRVLAIDKEASAFQHLMSRKDLTNISHLETLISPMEELSILPLTDLFIAAFVLPFCPPAKFKITWEKIVNAIKPSGLFVGHFFGDRDTWAKDPMQTHHTRQAVDQLFEQFTVKYFKEVEDDEPTVTGEPKHWHLFHVIAQKN